ncbi:MAG: hypothetical protein GX432_04640 [Candidatus Atribacteria bacterium]|nr:hypothetical protein [Candidatus Atribacteria bacterium]
MIRYIGIFGTHQENINPFKVLLILGNGFALNGDVGEGKLGNLKGIVILPYYSDPLTPYFLSNYNKKGAIHIKLLRKISFMDIKLKNRSQSKEYGLILEMPSFLLTKKYK